MNAKTPITKLHKDQAGLMAVVVTVFVMIILSLIVLAFSQVARREQRQAFDRQLSTQAFYAAESGINNMVNEIRSNPTIPIEKKECDDVVVPNSNKLDQEQAVSYSCVLYDKAPTSLEFGSIGVNNSEVVSLGTTTNNLSKLSLTWSDTDGGANFGGCTASNARASLPDAPAYTAAGCDAGMVRLYFMPIDAGGREALNNASYTVYLRPVKDGDTSEPNTGAYAPHSAGGDNQGSIVPAHCNTAAAPGKCIAHITGLPGSKGLFVQMKSIYKSNSVSLSATDGTTNTLLRLNQAQMKIDVTGKASDVLRRLQVRVPIYERYNIPAYAIESMSGICKRIGVLPGTVQDAECGLN